MRRSGSAFWGLLLLVVGTLFLLNNFGIMIFQWGYVFPIFLIAAGLWMLFSRGQAAEIERVAMPLDGAESAQIIINHEIGRARLLGATENNLLMSGEFSGGLDARIKREGGTVRLRMKRADFHPMNWFNDPVWDFRLSDAIPLTVKVEGSAGVNDLNFSALKVRELHIDGGVGTQMLTLPAAGQVDVKIDGGVGTVTVRIPEGVAAHIKTEAGLGTTFVDQKRFPLIGDKEYRSENYETAQNKVSLKIDGGVGTITVR